MSVTASSTNTFHGLPECIVALPYQLGYRPERSLVLVCLGDIEATGSTSGRGKVLLTARVDLPTPGQERLVMHAIIPALRRPETRGLITIVFDDDPAAATQTEFLSLVAALAGAQDVKVCAQAQVCGDRWLSIPLRGEDAASSAQTGWQPLPASRDVPGVASYVLAGRSPLRGREGLAEVFRRPESDLAAAAAATHAQMCAGQVAMELPASVARTAVRALQVVVRAQGGSLPTTLVADDIASVALALEDSTFRDAVLEVLSPGGLGPIDVSRARGEAVRPSLDAAVGDPAGVPLRLACLAGHLPTSAAPSLLSIVGYLAWCRGEGAVANIAIESALRLDPSYSLALLIDRALRSAVPPPGGVGQSRTEGA